MKRFFVIKSLLKPLWRRLELLLLIVLLSAALAGVAALHLLKHKHERLARRSATESVLQGGEALMNTIGPLGIACSTNDTPELWRRFSTIVDSAFSVREDVQSLAITHNGITVFQRHSGGLATSDLFGGQKTEETRSTNPDSVTRITRGAMETGGGVQPGYVISRTTTLPDDSSVVAEAFLKRDAVGEAERSARELVNSLHALSSVVLVAALSLCAIVLGVAVARDRARERRSRQEEHLAFSGMLANGILHDFRNPMSAARLDAQMLGREMARAEGFRTERVAELAGRIAHTMERMDKVFKEFLLLARPADEQLESVDISVVLRDCLDILAPRAEQAGVALELSDQTPTMVRALPTALRRALVNVVMNAIQFAPRESVVEARVTEDTRGVMVDILDRGPGVPAARRSKIFEMFETSRPEGTGLGLFIARTALERCGGTIEALERKGGGADFRVVLSKPKV